MSVIVSDAKKQIEKIKTVLCEISPRESIVNSAPVPSVNRTRQTLNDVIFAKTEQLKIDDCAGRVSASIDFACPPAIPIVLPGEIIDENAIECFKYYGINEWTVIK